MSGDVNVVAAIIGACALAASFVISWLLVKRRDAAERAKAEAHLAKNPALSPAEFGRNYFPPEQADIARRLRELLAPHLQIDLARLHPNDRLIDDLHMDALDSMSTVEFILAVEEEFKLEIPNGDTANIHTLGTLAIYVADRLHSFGESGRD